MLNLTQPHRSRITHTLTGLILILILSMFIAPGAMAGCNKKGKGKDCPPPPDPTPATQGNSVVGFTGSLIYDEFKPGDDPRECGSGQDNSSASGDYFCMVLGHPDITMNTQGLSVTFSKKHRTICNSLAPDFFEPPRY